MPLPPPSTGDKGWAMAILNDLKAGEADMWKYVVDTTISEEIT